MGLIKKGPDVSQASTVGEPTLIDPEPISAKGVQEGEARAFMEPAGGGNKLGVVIVSPEQPAANIPPAADAVNPASPFGVPPSGAAAPPAAGAPDPNELKPNAPADPNELKPTDTGADPSLPPPTQVNEIQGQSSSSATKAEDSTPASDQDLSSSKKKKKKGLQKINPF
jgi:outer membrane protein assembly factor BamD